MHACTLELVNRGEVGQHHTLVPRPNGPSQIVGDQESHVISLFPGVTLASIGVLASLRRLASLLIMMRS